MASLSASLRRRPRCFPGFRPCLRRESAGTRGVWDVMREMDWERNVCLSVCSWRKMVFSEEESLAAMISRTRGAWGLA